MGSLNTIFFTCFIVSQLYCDKRHSSMQESRFLMAWSSGNILRGLMYYSDLTYHDVMCISNCSILRVEHYNIGDSFYIY